MVGGKDLNPQSWYSLATNDFLAAGGDGYQILKQVMVKKGNDSSQEGSRVLLFDSGGISGTWLPNTSKKKRKVFASVEEADSKWGSE